MVTRDGYRKIIISQLVWYYKDLKNEWFQTLKPKGISIFLVILPSNFDMDIPLSLYSSKQMKLSFIIISCHLEPFSIFVGSFS